VKLFFTTLLTISMFFCSVVFSQEANEYQLAYNYFNNKEFEKAAEVFESLHKKTGSKTYFTYYIECLVELNELEKAEKAIKQLMGRKNTDLSLNVLLGRIYRAQDLGEKADNEYEKVLKELKPDRNEIVSIANQFIRQREYDWGEKIYLKARTITGLPLNFEMANLYANARKNNEMIQEYLNVLEIEPNQIETVQAVMQSYIGNDVNEEFYELLRTGLLRRIQKTNLAIHNDMLIWLFLQKKEFAGALTQAIALDKRNQENGQRVVQLAELAKQSEDYATAYSAYEYVAQKGRFQPFYFQARYGLTNILYLKVINRQITTSEQIEKLEKEYLLTIEEFGLSSTTINLIRDLAHLEAFFLNKTEDAISLINQAIAIQNITEQQRGICLIELGDIQLLTGDVWSATLTYARAENNNKANETGDEAKFKKARVAFYTGNFKWAHSQLDVLKASTSKLIANDAMELSLLIKGNLNYPQEQDSTFNNEQIATIEAPLKIYARADLLINQHKDLDALQTLDTLMERYPAHSLVDESYFLKAKTYENRNEFQLAAEHYEKIVSNYSYDILADKAMFRLANIYQNKLSQPEKAMDLYRQLIEDYPGSIFVTEARKRFRELRGK